MTGHHAHDVKSRDCGVLAWLPLLLILGLTSGCTGGSIWANSEEELDLPTMGVHTVLIHTDNGFVQVRPTQLDSDTIQVRAIIRAGGRDPIDAQACLDAIDIVTPTSGPADSVQEIRWAWKSPRVSHWRAEVSFQISIPAALDLKVEAVNGKIDVAGVTGACDLKSKNGAIRAWAVAAERLSASTQNGELDIESPARDIDLTTTNGKIVAALTGATVSKGRIETHNGEVRFSLDPAAHVEFKCQTSNGRITNRLPLRDVTEKSKKRLEGRMGDGGGTIEITTPTAALSSNPSTPTASNFRTSTDRSRIATRSGALGRATQPFFRYRVFCYTGAHEGSACYPTIGCSCSNTSATSTPPGRLRPAAVGWPRPWPATSPTTVARPARRPPAMSWKSVRAPAR